MALPRNTSRPIAIDGRDYRRTAASTVLPSQDGDRKFAITLIVESCGQANSRIFDRLVFPNVDSPWDKWHQIYQDDSLILPMQVVAVVKTAVNTGWNPDKEVCHESSILYELVLGGLHSELDGLFRG